MSWLSNLSEMWTPQQSQSQTPAPAATAEPTKYVKFAFGYVPASVYFSDKKPEEIPADTQYYVSQNGQYVPYTAPSTEKTAAQQLGEKVSGGNYSAYYGQLGATNTPYAAHFTINNKDYVYLPSDLVQKAGIQVGADAAFFPWFANKDNLATLSKNASSIDFSGTDFGKILQKSNLGTSGYLAEYSSVPFDSDVGYAKNMSPTGLENYDGKIVIGMSGGHGNRFYDPSDGVVHDYYYEKSGGLGGVLGDIAGDLAPLVPIATAFVAPQLGAALAVDLGISAAAGTVIASTALQVAAGADPAKALENAVTTAAVQTGSAAVAKEVNGALSGMDAATAAGISNAAGSALSSAAITAAKGGSQQDIINSAVAGAAGSAATTATGEAAVGGAVVGGLTGGTQGALVGAAGALGKEAAAAEQAAKTTEQKTAYQDLQDKIASSDLTTEEKASVQRAIQDVYSGASTAQALPATTTDVGGVAGRFGYPFASNDPDFYRALVKNPSLLRSFSEYSNTYGYSGAGDASFVKLLVDTYGTLPPNSQYAQDLKSELQSVLEKNPDLATTETQNLLYPAMSPVISQEVSAQPVASVVAAGQPISEYQPETAPYPSTATQAALSPTARSAIQTDITAVPRLATQPDFARTPTGGGTYRAPSFVIPPAKYEKYPTISDVAPAVTTAPEKETAAQTGVPTEDKTGKPVKPTETKPSLTTARGLVGASVTGPTGTLARALQGDFYPTSTTGLTAYRPAGEIESEETGKQRQDVWNEASLRLKDALGI